MLVTAVWHDRSDGSVASACRASAPRADTRVTWVHYFWRHLQALPLHRPNKTADVLMRVIVKHVH